MQIFVKTAAGKLLTVHVAEGTTVAALRSELAMTSGELFYAGMCLSEASAPLTDYAVGAESTIEVMEPVEGGKGKKKKKKIFTKPKKPTHRHKCEKMRALKYFKVTEKDDGSYKVERTRRECANPTCGSGVFLAKHKDREYCGKCHLTFKSK
eukprot:gene9040-6341_t